jgi:cytochrome c oxidase subunit 3
VGVLALTLCLCALGWLRKVEFRQIAVDVTTWYWHTLGLAWILLLAVLAVGQ